VLVIGFVAAALWRTEQAIWGYSYVDDKKKVRKKAVSAAKAVLFVILAVLAGRTAVGSGCGGGQQQQATAGRAGPAGGQFLVGLAGLIVIGVGVYKIVRGWKTRSSPRTWTCPRTRTPATSPSAPARPATSAAASPPPSSASWSSGRDPLQPGRVRRCSTPR
jgi:hypothetical protein